MFPPTETASSRVRVASRLAAMVLVAFLLAATGDAIDRMDRHALGNYRTDDELRVYLESYMIGGYWAWFGIALLFGFGYFAMIEGVAFVLRLPFRGGKMA